MNSLQTHAITITILVSLVFFVWLNLVLNFWPLAIVTTLAFLTLIYIVAYEAVDVFVGRWYSEKVRNRASDRLLKAGNPGQGTVPGKYKE